MKKILLIGDSIRMSYQESVKTLLEGKAEVNGPEENCRFAKYTLWNIHGYMDMWGKPDIIHWNNGIWDTFKISEDVPCFTPLNEYLRDMGLILNEMRKKCDTILFANTTPVGYEFSADNNEKIDTYNLAIELFMRAEGIPINDLNSVIKKDISKYIGEDLLHLSSEGVEVASKKVVSFISDFLF